MILKDFLATLEKYKEHLPLDEPVLILIGHDTYKVAALTMRHEPIDVNGNSEPENLLIVLDPNTNPNEVM